MTEKAELIAVPITPIKAVQAYGDDVLALYGDELTDYSMPVDCAAASRLLEAAQYLVKRLEEQGVTVK
jgi:hypothetical protein